MLFILTRASTARIHIVPKLVWNLRERYPDIRVELREMGIIAQLAALRSGEIDIAISYVIPGEEFQSKQLTVRFRVRTLARFFSGKRLSEITAWDAERYKVERLKEVKPATVNRELGNLKHMVNLAVRWGLADANPVREVKFLREEKRPDRILSRVEE